MPSNRTSTATAPTPSATRRRSARRTASSASSMPTGPRAAACTRRSSGAARAVRAVRGQHPLGEQRDRAGDDAGVPRGAPHPQGARPRRPRRPDPVHRHRDDRRDQQVPAPARASRRRRGCARGRSISGGGAAGGVRHPHGAPLQPHLLVRDDRRRGGDPARRRRPSSTWPRSRRCCSSIASGRSRSAPSPPAPTSPASARPITRWRG